MAKTLLVNRQAEQHLKGINEKFVSFETNLPACPSCCSTNVYKDGFMLNPYRQHYACREYGQGFLDPEPIELG